MDEFSFRGNFSSSNWTTVLTSGVINQNQLYHLVVTYNTSDGYKMFLDGSQVDSSSITEGIVSNDLTNVIGVHGKTNERFWDGKGDFFRVFSTTLSSDEITALYDAIKSTPDFFSQQAAENTEGKKINTFFAFPF